MRSPMPVTTLGRCKPIGHENIQHALRYTELAPDRFKDSRSE